MTSMHISASPSNNQPTLEMKISSFDGTEDAYWWILCSEKSFKSRELSDAEKLLETFSAMRGCALIWWLRWYPSHRNSTWDSFTSSLLWHFKPEWRSILPIEDEEANEESEQQKPSKYEIPKKSQEEEISEHLIENQIEVVTAQGKWKRTSKIDDYYIDRLSIYKLESSI